jgi:hypothetical protein
VIAQAAAIQDRLAMAGLPEAVIAWWWRRARSELAGLAPADCVALVGARAGGALLDLAERDVADLQRDAAGAPAQGPAARHTDPYDEGRASTCLVPPES